MGNEQPVYHLILKAVGTGWRTPPILRLRAALKRLRRDHGLVCISAIEEPEQDKPLDSPCPTHTKPTEHDETLDSID